MKVLIDEQWEMLRPVIEMAKGRDLVNTIVEVHAVGELTVRAMPPG